MPSKIVLGEHFEAFIEEQLKAGRYHNAGEIIRAGLRLLEEQERITELKRQQLHSFIQAGSDDDAGVPAEQVFERLEAKYRMEAAARGEPDAS
jgi:antitoxin ParD1/3/4